MFDWILIFLRTEHTRGGIVNNCPHHYLGVYLVIILSRPEASVPRLRVTGYGLRGSECFETRFIVYRMGRVRNRLPAGATP